MGSSVVDSAVLPVSVGPFVGSGPIGDEVLWNGEVFRPFVRLFVLSFVRLLICLFLCSFVRLFVCLVFQSFGCSFGHWFVRLFVCWSTPIAPAPKAQPASQPGHMPSLPGLRPNQPGLMTDGRMDFDKA